MGCNFSQDDKEKDNIYDRGDKITGRLSKRLRKINCRSEIEENQTLITENVEQIEAAEFSIKSENELNSILKNHFFFYSLSADERQEIINKMSYCFASAGSYIFKQGDPSCSFFIIH